MEDHGNKKYAASTEQLACSIYYYWLLKARLQKLEHNKLKPETNIKERLPWLAV